MAVKTVQWRLAPNYVWVFEMQAIDIPTILPDGRPGVVPQFWFAWVD